MNKMCGNKTFIYTNNRKDFLIMILVGIDVGKNSHYFTVVSKQTGEVLSEPSKRKR